MVVGTVAERGIQDIVPTPTEGCIGGHSYLYVLQFLSLWSFPECDRMYSLGYEIYPCALLFFSKQYKGSSRNSS